MLVHLTVRNFAIVDRLELELESGMTVLTGETGAGKSILIDALSLALGERAAGKAVRPGSDRAELIACFDLSKLPAADKWLRQEDLEDSEGECILRRTVMSDGRSRAFINGRPVSLQSLRTLGNLLIDIHGQQAHQSLLRPATQRQILDEFAGHALRLDEMSALYHQWTAAQREIKACSGGVEDQGARLELLRHQVTELEKLNIESGELEQLTDEHRRLSHINELATASQGTLQKLSADSDFAVHTQIEASCRLLGGLETYDAQLADIRALLDSAGVHVQEAASALRHYLDALDMDPHRLGWVEERLSAIHDLARKHHVRPEDLTALQTRLEDEITQVTTRDERLRTLQEKLGGILENYRALAQAVADARESAATPLSEEVTANMQRLGMPGGQFRVAVRRGERYRPSPAGEDKIEFQVRTNPGQPMQPLAKVASGGELSRIALAIQVIAAQGTGIPTLIFDEVDSGIGGRVAEIVGQQLRLLGNARQVLCITHLPQVASQAHHHIQVKKQTRQDHTSTRLESLGGEQRVTEIARMLGGVTITDQTLAHAREMLDSLQT